MCEIYFAQKPGDFIYVKLWTGYMFSIKEIKNSFKKLEAEKLKTYFCCKYATAKTKSTVIYLLFKKCFKSKDFQLFV